MEKERNRGTLLRTQNGYLGQINIENILLDLVCTFWTENKTSFVWIKRTKGKRFDEMTKTFIDYEQKPTLECYAYKERKGRNFVYKGNFMFVGYKYEMVCWFEDKTEHQVNVKVCRCEDQPILERLNELKKQEQG